MPIGENKYVFLFHILEASLYFLLILKTSQYILWERKMRAYRFNIGIWNTYFQVYKHCREFYDIGDSYKGMRNGIMLCMSVIKRIFHFAKL